MVRNPLSSIQCPLSPHINDLWRAQGWYIERNIHSGPQLILWSHKSPLYGLLFRLVYFFQSPIRDHVGAGHRFCILESLGMTQVSHLGLSDSYSFTIFHGFPSLTNPPKSGQSCLRESLASLSHLILSPTTHIMLSVDLGLMGRKTGWDGKDWWEGGRREDLEFSGT